MALYLELRPDVSEKEQIYHLKEQLELYLNNLTLDASSLFEGEIIKLKGDPGQDGKDGVDGKSSYIYLRYSANSDGSYMTETPQSDTAYLGVQITDTAGAGTNPNQYTWIRILGRQGTAGYSPQASVSKSGDTATITVTDQSGTTTATVSDGQDGPANTLTIGQVLDGTTAAASITGTPPNQVLNLTLPRGRDGQGSGDMLKYDYDQDNSGVVDDAERLGGQLPSYYAPASSLSGYLPLTGGTLTGTLDGTNVNMSGNVTATGDISGDDIQGATVASRTTVTAATDLIGENAKLTMEYGGIGTDGHATTGADMDLYNLLVDLGWLDILS